MKKRILIFGFTENSGGIENVIMNYYRNIDKSKFQFDFLINTDKIAFQNEIVSLGGRIFKVCSRKKNYKKYKKQLREFFKLNAKQYSAIWVNFCCLTNLDYLKYAKRYNISKRIIHSHNSQNMDSKLIDVIHKINKKSVTKYATDFWACSDEAGKWFFNKKIMQSDKYLVINNAIDLKKYIFNADTRNEYRKKLGLTEKIVIGNVGRLQFQKNQEFLIKIFEQLHMKNNNMQLLLVGQGEDKSKLKQLVIEKKLQDNVTFLGVRKDVSQLLQAMDIFVFPSVFEGLPLALIEAQASGLLVFASKDVIPQEVKMSDYFEFIGLEKTPQQWADIILNKYVSLNIKRENRTNEIEKCGYNIAIETKKLEKIL